MGSNKTFRILIIDTLFGFFKLFFCFIITPYMFFLCILSVNFVDVEKKLTGFIFVNYLSLIYFCFSFLIILGFNIIKMIKVIKSEINILYQKNIMFSKETYKDMEPFRIGEFIDINRNIELIVKKKPRNN